MVLIHSLCGYAKEESISNSLSVSIEKFSPSESINNLKYPDIRNLNPGHFKSIVTIHNLNRSKSYILKIGREIISGKDLKKLQEFPASDLFKNAEFYGRDLPILAVSSLGYIPGEEASFLIESEDEKDQVYFKLIPFPILANSKTDQAQVEAKLSSLNPAIFNISLKNFNVGEKIQVTSISGKEILKWDLDYRDNDIILHMPEVINEDRGLNKVTFKRVKTGEELSVILPWGMEVVNYIMGKREAS